MDALNRLTGLLDSEQLELLYDVISHLQVSHQDIRKAAQVVLSVLE